MSAPVIHYLVVPDIEAVGRELLGPGLVVSDVRHKSPIATWSSGWSDGLDPQRRDYSTFADVVDPDGNRWVLQERGYTARGVARSWLALAHS